MSKIEYLIAERSTSGYGGYEQYYTSEYGFSFTSSFFDLVGRDGWELVSDNGNQLKFKRVVEKRVVEKRVVEDQMDISDSYYDPEPEYQYSSNDYDYSEELQELRNDISKLAKLISQLATELSETKRREVILVALVQAFADKVMPDNPLVENLIRKLDPDGETGENKKAADGASQPKSTPDCTKDQALIDNIITQIMCGRDSDEIAWRMFFYIIGSDDLRLPGTTEYEHYRQVIEGMHRYYHKKLSIKIYNNFADIFTGMAEYFSSSDNINSINEGLKKPLTAISAAEIFFSALEIELELERQKASEFSLPDVAGLVNLYVTQVREDPLLANDGELTSTANAHIAVIRENFGLDLMDFTPEDAIQSEADLDLEEDEVYDEENNDDDTLPILPLLPLEDDDTLPFLPLLPLEDDE